ncbi:hypothetical protein MRX96_000644 [Rhipicephalus microplus]
MPLPSLVIAKRPDVNVACRLSTGFSRCHPSVVRLQTGAAPRRQAKRLRLQATDNNSAQLAVIKLAAPIPSFWSPDLSHNFRFTARNSPSGVALVQPAEANGLDPEPRSSRKSFQQVQGGGGDRRRIPPAGWRDA